MLIVGLNRIMEPIEVRCHVARQFNPGISILLLRIYVLSASRGYPEMQQARGNFVPSLLVFCKMLKLLTARVTGRVPSTACLLLRKKEGVRQY